MAVFASPGAPRLLAALSLTIALVLLAPLTAAADDVSSPVPSPLTLAAADLSGPLSGTSAPGDYTAVGARADEAGFEVRPRAARDHFSDDLFSPRLGQPVFREDGESFTILIGLAGTYSTGDVSTELVSPEGDVVALTVSGITRHVLTPGDDLSVMLYEEGLTEVQEITVGVPIATPADVYDIAVDVSTNHYESETAVRIYDDYPSSWGILHITDPHVGYTGDVYTAAERLAFFVEEANFLDPEIVVVTGDICEHQNPGTDWPQQFLDIIAGLKMPAYVIPGNHDYYNDGEGYDPANSMRYFHEINRFENSVVRLGNARFYGLDTRWDNGLFQLYRCEGPSSEALDWAETDIATLGSSDKPRFWLMHGPNYDKFSWIVNNWDRVRDIMNANDFALGLAGHSHRFETFLNSGTNSFGRNDFTASDDWVRDVAFPGYPLHTQTSSMGKDESLAARAVREARESGDPEALRLAEELAALEPEALHERGVFGDSITWRWVQVGGTDVTFYTADTDGDGYRNTEEPWPLGGIVFTIDAQPDSIVSSVENQHYETWADVRHYIPADPGTDYTVDGGTLVRRLPDGTVVVAVDIVGPNATSVVTLTPDETNVEDSQGVPALRLHPASPNPFNPGTRIAFELPRAADVALEIYSIGGRRVATLVDGWVEGGRQGATWRGTDDAGRAVASGVYLVRLRAGHEVAGGRIVLLK